jgi:hypothetical protein
MAQTKETYELQVKELVSDLNRLKVTFDLSPASEAIHD